MTSSWGEPTMAKASECSPSLMCARGNAWPSTCPDTYLIIIRACTKGSITSKQIFAKISRSLRAIWPDRQDDLTEIKRRGAEGRLPPPPPLICQFYGPFRVRNAPFYRPESSPSLFCVPWQPGLTNHYLWGFAPNSCPISSDF
jgi:hypothetical protein